MSVRPAKTQISLGIRPVWSESSLCAQWVAKDPSFLHVDSEDSDETGRMPMANLSLGWAHTDFVGFVMSRLIYHTQNHKLSCAVWHEASGTLKYVWIFIKVKIFALYGIWKSDNFTFPFITRKWFIYL